LPVILASRPSDKTKNEPINPGAAIINSDYLDTILPYGGIIANIPILENNSVGAGIVSTEPEIDGVVRRMPTVAVVDGVLYPSLALETLRVIAGDPSFQIKLSPLGIDKMRIPQFGVIPTDAEGRVWIDWSQRNKSASITNLPADSRRRSCYCRCYRSRYCKPCTNSNRRTVCRHNTSSSTRNYVCRH
jgi:hypothetical protein